MKVRAKPPKRVYVADFDTMSDQEFVEWEKFCTYMNWTPIYDMNDDPEVVLFTGGTDVNPAMYGEKPLAETQKPDLARDGREAYLFQIAQSMYPTPLMVGICRGAQFINVMCGGKLWQHVDNHTGCSHDTFIQGVKTPFSVTSDHHQMVIPPENGKGVLSPYTILAWSDKRANVFKSNSKMKGRAKTEIEAIYYKNKNALGVQWHPEWDLEGDSGKLFSKLYLDVLEGAA